MSESVQEGVSIRVREHKRERESVCVCVRERVCVCVCVRKREFPQNSIRENSHIVTDSRKETVPSILSNCMTPRNS